MHRKEANIGHFAKRFNDEASVLIRHPLQLLNYPLRVHFCTRQNTNDFQEGKWCEVRVFEASRCALSLGRVHVLGTLCINRNQK